MCINYKEQEQALNLGFRVARRHDATRISLLSGYHPLVAVFASENCLVAFIIRMQERCQRSEKSVVFIRLRVMLSIAFEGPSQAGGSPRSDSGPPRTGAPPSSASETETPPPTWTVEARRFDRQWLAAQGGEGLVLARSSGWCWHTTHGCGGAGAGVTLAVAEAISGREQLAAEALVDMAMKDAAVPQAHGQVCMPRRKVPWSADRQRPSAGLAYSAVAVPVRSATPVNAMFCTWTEPSAPAAKQLEASPSPHVACTMPAYMPAVSALTTGPFFPLPVLPMVLPRVTSYARPRKPAPPRRPAPPKRTPMSSGKRVPKNPCVRFCQEQRPLLPQTLRNAG